MTFAGLDLDEPVQKALARAGITQPTEVQTVAIPQVLAGRDAIIQSGTGTGKTLAYLLPLLHRVRREPTFRVLILAPSPELAIQILRVVEEIKGPGISSCALVGGANTDRQRDKLKQHPRVMVGTPGRALEMVFAKRIKTRDISALVLDETDEVLSTQNDMDLREIASRPEFQPQLIFASATFGPRSEKLAQDLMDPDPVRIVLGQEPLSATITHLVTSFDATRKEVALLRILEKHQIARAIVFVNKLTTVPHLYRFLNEHGVTTVALSSDRGKKDREEAMTWLREGKAKLLVATDGAARGLDIPGMDWVIHYEIARDEDTYVHRAGRTGRNQRPGKSLMMVAPEERFLLERYTKNLGVAFQPLA